MAPKEKPGTVEVRGLSQIDQLGGKIGADGNPAAFDVQGGLC
jgi:hypothetical protein